MVDMKHREVKYWLGFIIGVLAIGFLIQYIYNIQTIGLANGSLIALLTSAIAFLTGTAVVSRVKLPVCEGPAEKFFTRVVWLILFIFVVNLLMFAGIGIGIYFFGGENILPALQYDGRL